MKNNRGFVAVLIIGITAIIIAGVVAYALMQKSKTPSSAKSEKISGLEQSSATADWKTYRNEKYGFEIKYPRNWYFEPHLSNGYFDITDYKVGLGNIAPADRTGVRINIYPNAPYKNAEEWFSADQRTVTANIKLYSNLEKVILGGKTAIKARTAYHNSSSASEGGEIRAINNGTGYSLGYNRPKSQTKHESLKDLDLIVNSFKFIK